MIFIMPKQHPNPGENNSVPSDVEMLYNSYTNVVQQLYKCCTTVISLLVWMFSECGVIASVIPLLARTIGCSHAWLAEF